MLFTCGGNKEYYYCMFLLKLKKSYQPKKHTTPGHDRPASDMPSQWPVAGGPLMAGRCVLAGMETL